LSWWVSCSHCHNLSEQHFTIHSPLCSGYEVELNFAEASMSGSSRPPSNSMVPCYHTESALEKDLGVLHACTFLFTSPCMPDRCRDVLNQKLTFLSSAASTLNRGKHRSSSTVPALQQQKCTVCKDGRRYDSERQRQVGLEGRVKEQAAVLDGSSTCAE